MLARLLRKKSVGIVEGQEEHLHRQLDALDLSLMGIGAIIGAGVFVLTGIAAATKAGPAIVISYFIAGLASMFAAFAYAELASSVGGAGSAYSYAYAAFGEFAAWLIGWDLVLEYTMSVSTVAIGWSGYVNDLLLALHIHLPIALTKNYFDGGLINLLAVGIILFLSMILSIGVKLSARFNAFIVLIKLITIAVFIIVALTDIDVKNWYDFFPFGWHGVVEGAALVFFAYIGFDALSTAVEETVNPQRNVPIGIITSLIICTLIYIIVSALLTGIIPYTELNVRSPVSRALLNLGHRIAAGFVSAGAVAGLTTVMLVMYFGLSRICLAISRDGLFPKFLGRINPRTHTPIRIILISGIIMAAVSGFAPIDKVAELVNIGTLAAFTFVCVGVLSMRRSHRDMHRPFKAPLFPYTPLLGAFFCLYLMIYLPGITWLRFLIWAVLGFIIYFIYGIKHSHLNKQ